MSRRTADANKAIRLAWEREQKLVREGKGTRDWTKEQQQDILNPDKGKAYDKNGKAFEGQHMKSVAEYPEFQGNPDNIQFLTKEEHLEAHKGSWQNPTNWYYDPVVKVFIDFEDDGLIPCKVFELSNPIRIEIDLKPIASVQAQLENIKAQQLELQKLVEKYSSPPIEQKKESGLLKKAKAVGKFIIEHPIKSLEIVGLVAVGTYGVATTIKNNKNRNTSIPTSEEKSIASKIVEIIEETSRASSVENDVKGHKQRYHTKDGGEVWKNKAPYHRGGKKQ